MTAYQKLSQPLESGSHSLRQEDADIQLKIIKQAYETLSSNASRDAYDAGLARRGAIPAQFDKPFQAEVVIKAATWTPMKILLIIIASLMAIGMVIQISFMLMAYRHAQQVIGDADSAPGVVTKAEEKVIIQNYYQETGIRAKSKAEVEMLEAESRKEAEAEREQRRKENEKKEQDRKYQQFVDESRRVGDQVSANLRRVEDAAQRESEYKRQQEREDRMKQEAELARIEREKSKWNAELHRNYGSYR